jgi:Mitochondrial small ribosomal subunit Rsm22
MKWTDLDWDSLKRHREQFLGGKPCDRPYWVSEADLGSYDLTYGERIGWKWDAVLDELRLRGWRPPGGVILDWGCGSGIAGRRVIDRFGAQESNPLKLWDHSPLATRFALKSATAKFPGIEVTVAGQDFLEGHEPIGLLLLSHVLNELQPSGLEEVRTLAARARSILWTEPGSRETSRTLGTLRDNWLADFRLIAPCTHDNPCPVLAPVNERHWCHHFAAPPSAIFADSNWMKFGQRAGIDLRSLPYSFIALDRSWNGESGLSRVIGRPEHFKPYVRLLNCDSGGLAELEVMKRTNAPLCKELQKAKGPLVYRWTRNGDEITGAAAGRAP